MAITLLYLLVVLVPRVVSVSRAEGVCRDSYGYLYQSNFNVWTCSLCYTFLFPTDGFLFNNNRSHPALTRNFKTFFMPDIKVPATLKELCDGLGEERCGRWKSCCDAADKCCKHQIATRLNDVTEPDVCPQTWDGWSCFNVTMPGTKVTKDCPDFIEYGSLTGYVAKECTENGTWGLHPTKGQREWTDYRKCVNIKGFTGVVYAGAIASSLSLILLIPATLIFIGFRQLRTQQRIKLHVCLFVSFILTSSLQLLWVLRVYHDRISNPRENTFMVQSELLWVLRVYHDRISNPREDTFMVQSETFCKALYSLLRYARCTNYFWMFCEGLFLHRLLVQAFKCPSTIRLYFAIGWGCPLVPVTLYIVMREVYANETCWIKNAGGFEWLVYTPNLACIVFNLLFLLGILRILLTQLHQHPNEPSNYRRALKATFVLVPLFGLQLFLVIYRPSSPSVQNIYEISSKIIINSQGGIIALVFCYLNGEVLTCLKAVLRKYRFSHSAKAHSFATSYSVVTHRGHDNATEHIAMQEKTDGNANI